MVKDEFILIMYEYFHSFTKKIAILVIFIPLKQYQWLYQLYLQDYLEELHLQSNLLFLQQFQNQFDLQWFLQQLLQQLMHPLNLHWFILPLQFLLYFLYWIHHLQFNLHCFLKSLLLLHLPVLPQVEFLLNQQCHLLLLLDQSLG